MSLDKDVYKNYQLQGHLQPGRDKRPVSYLSTKSRVILSAVETSSGSVPQGRSFYTDTLQIVSQFGKWKKQQKTAVWADTKTQDGKAGTHSGAILVL